MLLQSCTPTSVEVRKQDLRISVLKSYKLQKVSLHKSCASPQDSGIDDSIQSCKLCGKSEDVLNLLLCDRCEEAFYVSCCKPRVVLPIDEWFCHSCAKIGPQKMVEINSLVKSRTISEGIGPSQFEFGPVLGPIAAMTKYPEPFTSKVRIGDAYQAQVPDWSSPTEAKTDNKVCSDSADSQLKSHAVSRKRKKELSSWCRSLD